MKQFAFATVMVMAPLAALSNATSPVIEDVVTAHILPRLEALAERSQIMADAAQTDCAPTSEALRAAYGDAFDAWIAVSHLRFGPSEVDDRAFALAFWPDTRGVTPRSLSKLIADQDPIAETAAAYQEVSVAARGFYAMEFLLYDDAFVGSGDESYSCMLMRTISADIAATSQAILGDWQSSYAETMLQPGPDGVYRTDEEALQEAFQALTTGLQFTSETRLGRPLGTFDRPRPARAEARRSERSARHVVVSLESLRDLAARLAAQDAELAQELDASFDRAINQASNLDDPVFAGVAEPQTRIKVESLQRAVNGIRTVAGQDLGPTLGVAVGFNSMDGD